MKKYILILSLLFPFTSFANIYSAKDGEIKFLAIGKPGWLKIKGESKGKGPSGKVTVEKSIAKGEFSFDLTHLDTGIDLRNEHMKEKYLETGKFPTAKLAFDSLSVTEAELKDGFSKDFKGQLTLHGVTKEVNGKLKFDGKKSQVNAQLEILVSDFKIDIPKYMGVTVSEKVEIEVSSNLGKE